MAKTPNIGLTTLDWENEASRVLFDDWVKSINGTSNSNMVKIDSSIGKLMKDVDGYKGTLTGDGANTTFTVNHNRNNLYPVVSVFDETTGYLFVPEIKTTNNNTITITFLNLIELGKRLVVLVH